MPVIVNSNEEVLAPASLLWRIQPLKQMAARFIALEKHVAFPFQGSNPEPEPLGSLLQLESGLSDRLNKLTLDYTNPSGLDELRATVSRLYQETHPDEVVITTGAEAALYFICQSLLKTGDHVILQYPCYMPLAEMLAHRGCRVSFWHARSTGYDWEDLPCLLRIDTCCLLTNSPHNPTGLVLPEKVKHQIARLCNDYGLLWISDEAYAGLEEILPVSACELSEQAISVGSLSKAFGLPGLRIGWLVSRKPAFRERVLEQASLASLGNSPLNQSLAVIALRHRKHLLQKNRQQMLDNRHLLGQFIETHADWLEWNPPQAGTVAFPRLCMKNMPAKAFCLELAEQQNVLFLPGELFLDTEKHIRINLARRGLDEALVRLSDYMASWLD